MTKFLEINFLSKYKYISDSENMPIELYNDTFPIAKKIDFNSVFKNKLIFKSKIIL